MERKYSVPFDAALSEHLSHGLEDGGVEGADQHLLVPFGRRCTLQVPQLVRVVQVLHELADESQLGVVLHL